MTDRTVRMLITALVFIIIGLSIVLILRTLGGGDTKTIIIRQPTPQATPRPTPIAKLEPSTVPCSYVLEKGIPVFPSIAALHSCVVRSLNTPGQLKGTIVQVSGYVPEVGLLVALVDTPEQAIGAYWEGMMILCSPPMGAEYRRGSKITIQGELSAVFLPNDISLTNCVLK